MKVARINKDNVFSTKDFNNNDLVLRKSIHQTAFLTVNNHLYVNDVPYLKIRKDQKNGYHVFGCYGIALRSGNISTQKLLKCLKKLGFSMDAKQLKKWICA